MPIIAVDKSFLGNSADAGSVSMRGSFSGNMESSNEPVVSAWIGGGK